MPEICISILYTKSWEKLASIVLPNIQEYANRHGYILYEKEYDSPFSGFEKLMHVDNLLNKFNCVWSLDLDVLITNYLIKVEDFLDDENSLFICRDYNGINAGSFLIRNTKWTDWFLKKTLSYKGRERVYCEQDAFVRYMNVYGRREIKILKHPSINSYHYNLYPEIPPQTHEQGDWRMGDFLLHLPGIGHEKRIEILSKTPIIK